MISSHAREPSYQCLLAVDHGTCHALVRALAGSLLNAFTTFGGS
jgi:hypothetical protein